MRLHRTNQLARLLLISLATGPLVSHAGAALAASKKTNKKQSQPKPADFQYYGESPCTGSNNECVSDAEWENEYCKERQRKVAVDICTAKFKNDPGRRAACFEDTLNGKSQVPSGTAGGKVGGSLGEKPGVNFEINGSGTITFPDAALGAGQYAFCAGPYEKALVTCREDYKKCNAEQKKALSKLNGKRGKGPLTPVATRNEPDANTGKGTGNKPKPDPQVTVDDNCVTDECCRYNPGWPGCK